MTSRELLAALGANGYEDTLTDYAEPPERRCNPGAAMSIGLYPRP